MAKMVESLEIREYILYSIALCLNFLALSCKDFLRSKTKKRWRNDGLNKLRYRLVRTEKMPLFAHFLVDLQEDDARLALRSEIGRKNNCTMFLIVKNSFVGRNWSKVKKPY